ncbi:PKD domain-containing protein [Chryseosolibacter indicus]|uniref:PKD domain-containing protein n=1 Tax=Chryseosolibacter indicus TaxID=2782351 RepID=A0ABS5VRF9_9BACT|nr:PKD domain-containing protein [Chryseosolibacter indicus]MBT1702601.1 PKD domain-containing protein [Chryseosolibacter indicus]
MKLKSIITKYSIAFGISAIAIIIACQPDEFEGNGNGILSPKLDSTFTITPVIVEGKTNTYVFNVNDMTNVLGVKWDLGQGLVSTSERTDTIFYPLKGVYNLTLKLTGIGGRIFSTTQQLLIEKSDPNAINILQGPEFNTGDEAYWTQLNITPGVTFSFADGKTVVSGGNGGHAALYQPVNVTEGKKYKLDMTVSGKGAVDTWFEVYLGYDAPVQGKDYGSGGNLMGLNTWSKCGDTPFNTKLSSIACSGNIKGNALISITKTGTAYLVIKCGGKDLGEGGISIDDVELRLIP